MTSKKEFQIQIWKIELRTLKIHTSSCSTIEVSRVQTYEMLSWVDIEIVRASMSDRIARMSPSTDSSKPRENFDVENLNISFNGCGFLGVYHVGVACALNHYMPNMKIKNICGASAGAMAAVCLIAGVPSGKQAHLSMYLI